MFTATVTVSAASVTRAGWVRTVTSVSATDAAPNMASVTMAHVSVNPAGTVDTAHSVGILIYLDITTQSVHL